MAPLPWSPRFTLTPSIARGLMQIEAARALVDHTPLSPAAEAELRARARVRAAHYSTFIEGNRLTLEEARAVIVDGRAKISGRERDVSEVRGYWNALLRVEDWAGKKKPLTEELIKRLHALVEYGPRTKPTSYREGQNAIRDSATGALIYLPPEAKDVPDLMAALVQWANEAERSGLPVPLIAGLVHYQFVTIHPYYDGNGRTARLLATFILHKGGYGLGGFFSLEEHYAGDLQGYYTALTVHPHHNYYFGRSEADLNPGWNTSSPLWQRSSRLSGRKPRSVQRMEHLLSPKPCAASITEQGLCWVSLPGRRSSPPPRWQKSWACPSAWPETFSRLG